MQWAIRSDPNLSMMFSWKVAYKVLLRIMVSYVTWIVAEFLTYLCNKRKSWTKNVGMGKVDFFWNRNRIETGSIVFRIVSESSVFFFLRIGIEITHYVINKYLQTTHANYWSKHILCKTWLEVSYISVYQTIL
jgi:hypothetical protein